MCILKRIFSSKFDLRQVFEARKRGIVNSTMYHIQAQFQRTEKTDKFFLPLLSEAVLFDDDVRSQ